MRKAFWWVVGAIGIFIYLDGMLQQGLRKADDARAVQDLRNVVTSNGDLDSDALKKAQPNSEVGKVLIPYLKKVDAHRTAFVQALAKVRLDGIVDWTNIDTAPERQKALQRIAKSEAIWRDEYATIQKDQRELLASLKESDRQEAKKVLDKENAIQTRIFRLRFEWFDRYRALISTVSRAKLAKQGDKVVFADDNDFKAYLGAVDACKAASANFNKTWKDAQQQYSEDRNDRMDDLAYRND